MTEHTKEQPLAGGPSRNKHPTKPKVNWKNGPPSCKECVRLKLKCSRSWPCTSCVRRGCEKICPLGTLAGRPSKDRATIARLEKENDELRARLGQLQGHDGGLVGGRGEGSKEVWSQSSQHADETDHEMDYGFSAVSPAPDGVGHLGPDERDDNHLDPASGPGTGHIEMGREGAKYLGRGAGSLFVCEEEESPDGSQAPHATLHFPFMATDKAILATVHELFPPVEDAMKLYDIYMAECEWMYRPTDHEAVKHTLEEIYSGYDTVQQRIHHVPPHRLATVLMVFALGLKFLNMDINKTAPFFNAASALLCVQERHFMVRHSLAAVEALHMMVSYLFNLGHSEGPKAAWQILGLCVRTACSIGLHRDASEWGLSAEQRDRRSVLWYECLTYDVFQSLNFGRPYSTPIQLIDAPRPNYPPDGGAVPHDSVFHVFKYNLAYQFMKVADYLASSELPDYSEIVKLDTDLRAVEAAAPAWIKWSDIGDNAWTGLATRFVVQQHSATMFFNKGLLMLHRPWFFKSVNTGAEPMLGPWALSFTTCVLSARKHTRLVSSLLRRHSTAAYNWWYFIFHAYTAAVIQYTVISRVPHSMMADDVRADFQASCDLMKQMSEYSGFARRALPMLSRLKDRLSHSPKLTPGSDASNPILDMLLGTGAPPAATANVATAAQEVPYNIGGGWGGWAGPDATTTGYPVTSASAFDTGLMLGFEDPAPQTASSEQMSITDPLIQTLLYWNVIGNSDGGAALVPQL